MSALEPRAQQHPQSDLNRAWAPACTPPVYSELTQLGLQGVQVPVDPAPAHPAPAHVEAAVATPAKQPAPAEAPASFSASKEPDAQQLVDRLRDDVLKKGAPDIACGLCACIAAASAIELDNSCKRAA